MSKRTFKKDCEFEKLTLSPTTTPEETNLTSLGKLQIGPKASSTSLKVKGSDSPFDGKKKLGKSYSGSMVADKNRSHSLAAPNDLGHSKVLGLGENSVAQTERSASVSPPQKKESASLFSRTASKSFRNNTKLPSFLHKEDHLRSPIHLKIKDHFMGRPLNHPKATITTTITSSSSWVRTKGKNVTVKEEVKEPQYRRGAFSPLRLMKRPTQHHTFSSDAADVQQIEKRLLQLMDDFETGKLKAFGKDSRLRQMEEIREQQERLARLHFDVGAKQDLYPPLSEDGLRISDENMRTLMEKLAQLSESIENLHTNTHSEKKTSITDGKHVGGNANVSEGHASQTVPQTNTNESMRHSPNTNASLPLHNAKSPNTTIQNYSKKPSNIQSSKAKEQSAPLSTSIDSNANFGSANVGKGTSVIANTANHDTTNAFQIKLSNPKQDLPIATEAKPV